MAKFKVIQEFIDLANTFQKLSSEWSKGQLTIVKEDSLFAVPTHFETQLPRLARVARICLKRKGVIVAGSYALVKKNIPKATIFVSQLDQRTYLRINNFLFKLL